MQIRNFWINKKKSKNDRENYLKLYSKLNILNLFHTKNSFFFPSSISKLIYSIIRSNTFIIFIVSQFFENKSSFALLVEYPSVLNNLIQKLKGCDRKEIFYFSIFERNQIFLLIN